MSQTKQIMRHFIQMGALTLLSSMMLAPGQAMAYDIEIRVPVITAGLPADLSPREVYGTVRCIVGEGAGMTPQYGTGSTRFDVPSGKSRSDMTVAVVVSVANPSALQVPNFVCSLSYDIPTSRQLRLAQFTPRPGTGYVGEIRGVLPVPVLQ